VEIDTKECIKEITNWMKVHHDSFPRKTGYVGNFYSSGKKASHWKRRGILKQGDVTIRVFQRENGGEAITPGMILVDLPEEFIVVHSVKDKILKVEPMSLANITRLKIKVSTSFSGFFNFDDGKFADPIEIEKEEAERKKLGI
jgi:hypothetical protein